jgi:Spy/CpxP family protein refolding chaperone
MDWIQQNKLKNWALIVLLACNLLTISILWLRTSQDREPAGGERGFRPPESPNLLSKALNLNEEQFAQAQNVLVARREQTKAYNERSTELKRQLAEELMKDDPDTALARAAANEIGTLQAKVELIRFNRFHELVALCTPQQKEMLRSIVVEVLARKPPKDELGEQTEIPPGPRPSSAADSKRPRPLDQELPGDAPRPLRNDGPGPPSVEDKVERYTRTLRLTDDQVQKVREVLQDSKKKGEELRARQHPEQGEIEAEREKLRKEEDTKIENLLTDEQKREFARMIMKRPE